MKIIIAGYGKMGMLIEAAALRRGDVIAALIDPVIEASVHGDPVYKNIDGIASVDKDAVVIDFTHPAVVMDNIKCYAERKLPAVIGTTGWYEKLDMVKKIIANNDTALLYASNFSLGVSLFYKIAEYAAALIDAFPDYDVGGCEVHHNQKADSPSGTAKTLVEKMLAVMSRKKTAVYETLDRAPRPDELHFASIRAGSIPGTHTVLFDSAADTIEIRHCARNREGFAAGALAAAHWLADGGPQRRGVFTLEDMLNNEE
jgi:4-hydroxy-tetrahydrodipicolinate reductase